MRLRAIRGFEYPESREVRDKIRRWHRSPSHDGVPYPNDRGVMVEVVAGEAVTTPDDLLHSWLDAGLVEDLDVAHEEAAE